jgi:competence protein ComGC
MNKGLCSILEKENDNLRDLRAFTRVELACVIGAFTVLLLVALPLFANTSLRSNQASCLNNLRQIGVAFQAWGSDHDDRRPWLVPMSEGGSAGHILRNEAWFQYSWLSNHMSPSLLMDPSEKAPNKRMTDNWGFSPVGGLSAFKDNAVSYMLGCHTSLADANEMLVADRHVRFNFLGAGCSYGFNRVASLNAFPFYGWTNGLHGYAGNLLLNDGRVDFTSQDQLKRVLTRANDGPVASHFLTPF